MRFLPEDPLTGVERSRQDGGMLSLSLAEFPSLSTEERLALGRQLAHTLGPAWAASGELVGSSQMIELVHQSGVAFVVVGRARFERGLRDAERDALITAMLGPQGEDEAELDLEAERRFMARQIPPNAMAPDRRGPRVPHQP
ncbi:MAG: hypothetical protein IPN77_33095 [Sandaracinaceae bacterium]|nr:hypothetical protein [Sandaracinaceae bacterium]